MPHLFVDTMGSASKPGPDAPPLPSPLLLSAFPISAFQYAPPTRPVKGNTGFSPSSSVQSVQSVASTPPCKFNRRQAAIPGFGTLLPAGCIPVPAGSGPN